MPPRHKEDERHLEECGRRYDPKDDCSCLELRKLEDSEAVDKAQAEIDEILDEFKGRLGNEGTGQIRCQKWNEKEREFAHCQTYPFDDFSLDSLRDAYGGGKYRFFLLDDRGRPVKGGSRRCLIAERPAAASAAAPVPAAPQNPMENPIVQMMLENLREQNRQSTEILKALIARPEPPRQGLGEVIESLGKIKALTPEVKGNNLKDTLELIAVAKGFLGEGKSSGEGGIVSELVDALKLMRDSGLVRGGQVPAAPVPTLPSPPSIETSTVAPRPAPVMDPITQKLQGYIPLLLSWGRRGESVENAADFVLGEIEDDIAPFLAQLHGVPVSLVLSRLKDAARDPREIDKLLTAAPALREVEGWVRQVIALTLRYSEEPAAEEAPAAAPPTPSHAV